MNKLFFVLLLFFVLSCNNSEEKKEDIKKPDLCKDITCDNLGLCNILNGEAICECKPGYTNGDNKLTCIKKEEEDKCQNINCEDFEICIEGECNLKDNACYTADDCLGNKECKDNLCIDKIDDFNLQGIYSLVGNDNLYGNYTGKVEIRSNESGEMKTIHLIEYDNAEFEGLKIAQVWIGEIDKTTLKATVTLYQKSFIANYNELTRNIDSPYKTLCTSNITRENNVLTADFTCENAESFNFNEIWTRISDNGNKEIWKNERIEIESHEEISQTDKDRRFQLYSSFHELEDVQPYVNRDDFKRAMHFYIYDPTDLKYYRENSSKLRVIQKTIDDISLKETKQRRDAYYMTLSQKQVVYDAEMQDYFLNEEGMYSNYNVNNNTYLPSGDGMLWTGVYLASEAMRYIKTNSTDALQNMIKSLRGQIKCFYITGSDSTFARSIRPHEESAINCSGNPEEDNTKWCKGSGVYANTDYLMTGNNDMFKGYVVAFPWAYLALKKAGNNDDLINDMKEVMKRLVENNDVANDHKINEFISYLMLYMIEDSFLKKQEYKARYESVWEAFVDPWLVDQGNGARYDYGTADWSGTHLNIQTLISAYIIFNEINDESKKHAIKVGFKNALENMRFTNQGLFQLASSTLGEFSTIPEEQFYSIWYLKSYIAPKKNISFDWRINPEFSMSPYPNLPWKNDWTSPNENRTNSLRMYPNFQLNIDDYMFKSTPFGYRGWASNAKQGNADYLFAYWFARYFNVIDGSD